MNLIIIGDSIGIPNGMAPTSRTLNLAKAFKESGAAVRILLCRPSEFGEIKNHEVEGKVDSIPFEYANKVTYYSRHWIVRRIQNLWGLIRTLYLLSKYFPGKEENVVLAYSRNITTMLLIRGMSYCVGYKIILELCEWPESQFSKHLYDKFRKKVYCRYALKLCDGVIVISRDIAYRVQKFCKTHSLALPVIQVPVLVNLAETNYRKIEPNRSDYLFYCGSFVYTETIIHILSAFKKVVQAHPKIELIISGSGDEAQLRKVKSEIRSLRLKQSVTLAGFLPRNELLAYMKHASALLIPLENDPQSNARFPTKVGEYLLSETPVITHAVGDLKELFLDRVNIFFCKEYTPEELFKSIDEVLRNPSQAAKVGQEGRREAVKHFSYSSHVNSLNALLNSISSKDA